ncbi:MAG: hypothetical protein ACOCRX_11475 [Candidatus Woesearchaeota archaeon]
MEKKGIKVNKMWYKKAKDFSDRNLFNHKVRYLKQLYQKIDYLKDMVYQSGTYTQKVISNIIYSNKITSYPELRDHIISMYSSILDSPQTFEYQAIQLMDRIQNLIQTLKKEQQTKHERMKGWK